MMKSVMAALRGIVKARSAAVARAAACIVFAAALAIPTATALADPITPEARAPVRIQGQLLERLLKREQAVLLREEKRLTQAKELATRIQTYIDNQKAKGKDTSKLEKALAEFREAIASAQKDYDTAKAILEAKAGFDENGKVVDVAQARETVREAGKAEREFHRTIRKAVHQLRIAIRQYRHDNGANAEGAELR